ncbi:MAG: molybdopterin-dependent oxidoreductase [Desulfobacterales bacterium]|nr:molybdopterin-dependent oxidoreductase [Desulfobacterales bacterium]
MPDQFSVSCPMDYFDLCRFVVEVEKNRVISLKGDPDHPLTRGQICHKAKNLVRRLEHPDRLTRPLIRTKSGFSQLSYQDVFQLLAEKLDTVKKEYGNTAVLNYTSDGYGGLKNRIQSIFFNTFGGDSRFSGSLCWSAGMAAQKYDFGQARGNSPLAVLDSELIIIWGRNPKATNLHLFTLLGRARKKGARIIVIDPLETATAKHFNSHIRVNPGTDGALALALAREIIKEDLHDKKFIKDNVVGFRRFNQSIKEMTPEIARDITGVPAGQIRELARIYGKTKSASIYIGYGMQRYENGGSAVRSINALAAISGHIGIPGAGLNYASKSLAPYLSGPEKRSRECVVNQRTFPAPCLGSFMAEADDPPVKMGFFSCGNPLVQTPDLNRALNGFSAVEFTVVFDQVMTDTAARADLILPAATVFEQEDLFVTSMFSHWLNFSQKAVDPPDTLMPEFEFYLELARTMGLDLGFSCSGEYLELCALPLITALQGEGNFKGNSLDDLGESNPRFHSHDTAWADKKFLTPSGKIELFSETAEKDGLNPLPAFTPPMTPPERFPLRLLTCHTADSMHSQGFTDVKDIPVVYVNAETAARSGLGEGDRAEVRGENGSIRAIVKIDGSIIKNTAFIYQGYWHKSGAVNFLTCERVTDMGHQAAFYDSFCSLCPV